MINIFWFVVGFLNRVWDEVCFRIMADDASLMWWLD